LLPTVKKGKKKKKKGKKKVVPPPKPLTPEQKEAEKQRIKKEMEEAEMKLIKELFD
jgi:hypothetical protein